MRTILWTQNENLHMPSTILVDGRECKDEKRREEAFIKVNEVNKTLFLSSRKRLRLAEKNRKFDFSDQINYFIDEEKKIVYLQSSYLDRDSIGRRLPFMFMCYDSGDLHSAIECLVSLSQVIGRQCNTKELSYIKRNYKIRRFLSLKLKEQAIFGDKAQYRTND